MSKGWASFLVVVLAIPAGIWAAFVTLKLWSWFAVPIGAPSLSLVRVMGLAIIVGMYRSYPTPDPKAKDKEGGEIFADFLIRATMLPAIALFFGWLYTNFL